MANASRKRPLEVLPQCKPSRSFSVCQMFLVFLAPATVCVLGEGVQEHMSHNVSTATDAGRRHVGGDREDGCKPN